VIAALPTVLVLSLTALVSRGDTVRAEPLGIFVIVCWVLFFPLVVVALAACNEYEYRRYGAIGTRAQSKRWAVVLLLLFGLGTATVVAFREVLRGGVWEARSGWPRQPVAEIGIKGRSNPAD
jgi:hypothetical protein